MIVEGPFSGVAEESSLVSCCFSNSNLSSALFLFHPCWVHHFDEKSIVFDGRNMLVAVKTHILEASNSIVANS